MGAFAGVELEALRFGLEVVLVERFGVVRREIRRVPGVAVCPRCGISFVKMSAPFECPECGVPAQGVSGGEDLRVT